eukprot:6358961-Lingulodinium_polyedra.AAC.1
MGLGSYSLARARGKSRAPNMLRQRSPTHSDRPRKECVLSALQRAPDALRTRAQNALSNALSNAHRA